MTKTNPYRTGGNLQDDKDTVARTAKNKNAVIDATNSAPDYYTATLNKDINEPNRPSTTGTNDLNGVTDEVIGDVENKELREDADITNTKKRESVNIPSIEDLDPIKKEVDTISLDSVDVDNVTVDAVPESSNAGGSVKPKNATDENTVSSEVGEPGAYGVDEGTD